MQKNLRGLENIQEFTNQARMRDEYLNSVIEKAQKEKLRKDEEQHHTRQAQSKKVCPD